MFISAEAKEKWTEDNARLLARSLILALSWGLQGGKYSLTKGGFVQTERPNEKFSFPLPTESAKGQGGWPQRKRATFSYAYSQVEGTADCW